MASGKKISWRVAFLMLMMMSGVGYVYDWIRRCRRKEERSRRKGREIKKKVKKAMKYRHSRKKIARGPRKRR